MAIYYNSKEITLISRGTRAISSIYKGTRLVWMGVRSCFGAGYWVSDKPWQDDEAWK